MSDDEYDYYQYEQPQQEQMQQENIETTLQFQNCQAEQLLRQNKFQQALKSFQIIYTKANQHNSRTWKAKALHQLLEMHVRMGNMNQARETLHSIREMNQVDKTNQQSVKSIIKTLDSVKRDVYESFWEDIFALISGLEDYVAQVKCYFLMFEKEINLKNQKTSTVIYDKINQISSKITQLPMSSQLQFKYLQIMYLKLHKQQYITQLQSLYIKLPEYEQDTNSNQTYLSSIKEQIAPTLYKEENYIQCANFLCGSFIQNAKYGSNSEKNKGLLKINSLMVLLCGDLKYLEDSDFNPMLQESTAVYKIQTDIQALFGLAQAFRNQDIHQFEQILKIVNLNLPKNSPYIDIQKRVLIALKKQKIASICQCYKTIKYSYLKRRINETEDSTIQSLLFSLITSGKIHGVIHLAQKYLEIVPEDNTYYTIQLENLRDLTQRM